MAPIDCRVAAEGGNRRVVRIEEPAFRQKGVHEGIADGAFNHLAERRPRDEERVHVEAVGVQRTPGVLEFSVVDRDEHQIDVRFVPDLVVRQAAAEDRRENGPIVLDLFDERVERCTESLVDRLVTARGRWSPRHVGYRAPSLTPAFMSSTNCAIRAARVSGLRFVASIHRR